MKLLFVISWEYLTNLQVSNKKNQFCRHNTIYLWTCAWKSKHSSLTYLSLNLLAKTTYVKKWSLKQFSSKNLSSYITIFILWVWNAYFCFGLFCSFSCFQLPADLSGIDVASGGTFVNGSGTDSNMLSPRFVFNLERPSSFQKIGRLSFWELLCS